MKHILLPTDFSKNSITAMRYALNLFGNITCNFYVLHVESSKSYTTDNLILAGNTSIYNTFIKKTKNKLTKLVAKLESEFKNENFSYQIIADYDVLTDSIKQVKKSKNIDLIVMGTNGVTGAKEVLFGSNTINVIRKVNCLTLVIPENFKYRKPNDVLLPLDILDSIKGSPFMDILNFTNRFGKTLHILRIKPHNEDSIEEKKDKVLINYFLNKTDHKYYVIKDIPIHYAVSCYSQIKDIILVGLLVQKEGLLERFFMGSPTTQISNNIKVPLLISHS